MRRSLFVLLIVTLGLFSVACLGRGVVVPDPEPEPDPTPEQPYEYKVVEIQTSRGVATAHLIYVYLTHPDVYIDVLYPGKVAAREALSTMANRAGAVAGINGDFFNISNGANHEGAAVTYSAVGPMIVDGEPIKGPVPPRQRFGPGANYSDVRDVIGVGVDGRARVAKLELEGEIVTPYGTFELAGLNQYAIANNGIGLFNHHWGSVSRKRAICGSDSQRDDPCSTNVFEVTVKNGIVTSTSDTPGSGDIAEDTFILLGREQGADKLRQLKVGDAVSASYELVSSVDVPFKFAIGAHHIVKNGVAGTFPNTTPAIRAAAGVMDQGRVLVLMALDGNNGAPASRSLTFDELAAFLASLGVEEGVNLDGGGSTTMVLREPGSNTVRVLNRTDSQRLIPNGIGVFLKDS